MFQKCKNILFVLLIISVSTAFSAAKRGNDDGHEQQPSAQKRGRLAQEAQLEFLQMVCRSAHARLKDAFSILIDGAGPSEPPVIIFAQQEALNGAAGALKIITAQVRNGSEELIHATNALADDMVRALESVVLPASRAIVMSWQQAVDGYNDAVGRTHRADGSPVLRLRDAAIADEKGRFRYSDVELAAYDARIPDLLLVGEAAPSTAWKATGQEPKAMSLASDEVACAICLDAEETNHTNPLVWLGCCNNKFHKGCLILQFTKQISDLGVPACVLCRKPCENTPPALVGKVPTIDPINLLFTGVINGSLEFVQRALSMGADVKTRRPDDHATALHCAAENGSVPIVMLLLEHGADIAVQDFNGMTPLHWAAEHRHIDLFTAVLAHCKDKNICNIIDIAGWNILHVAADSGYAELVALILAADPTQLNARTHDGETALILACKKDHKQVIQTLIAAIRDLPKKLDYLKAAAISREALLILASIDGAMEVVADLIEKSAKGEEFGNMQSTDIDPKHLLMLAVQKGYAQGVQGILNAIKQEAEKISYVKTPAVNGDTLLMVAARNGNLQIVQALLGVIADSAEKSAYVRAIDEYQKTALIYAIENGHVEVVQALVTAITDKEEAEKISYIKTPAVNGDTLLMVAARNGNLQIVQALLGVIADSAEKSAYVRAIDEYQKTALMYAIENGHVEVVQALVTAITDLADRSSYVTVANQFEQTGLMLAVKKGSIEIVEILLAAIADPVTRSSHVTFINKYGKTSLMLAAQNENLQLVEALLNAIIDPHAKFSYLNAIDLHKKTALTLATEKGNLAVAELLRRVTAETERAL